MCVCAAISSDLGYNADCICFVGPFLGAQAEAIEPGLSFNYNIGLSTIVNPLLKYFAWHAKRCVTIV